MEIKEENFFKEITFAHLQELFNWFIDMNLRGLLKNFVFRGISNNKWALIPSVLRNSSKFICSEKTEVYEEITLLKKFYNNANSCGLPLPQVDKWFKDVCINDYHYEEIELQRWPTNDILELLALAQHSGVKTRLLDWTKNFFVALYFAAQNCEEKPEYCSVWAVNQSMISSIFSRTYNIDKCAIKFYTPNYFQNNNLKAQQGILSYVEIPYKTSIKKSNEEFDKLLLNYTDLFSHKELNLTSEIVLYKLNIPSRLKNNLIDFLQNIGINKITLFPNYSSCSEKL